jgi:hypothetical protein
VAAAGMIFEKLCQSRGRGCPLVNSITESLLSGKVLPVAQAFHPVQTGWRAGTPAPLTFSCFTGEPKAH